MTSLAPLLETFFTERLRRQRQVSPHTIAAYRDAFRLLLGFAEKRLAKLPSDLLLTDLDASFVGAFLDHLEKDRGNSARSRNARLAAIRSFFRFAATREPAHGALIQRVLAIPQKRFDRKLVTFLNHTEIDALLAVPDRNTRRGRRDHALLAVAVQTGLRVSELTALRVEDIVFGTGAHLRCRGKGRKERCTPLTRQTAALIRAWLTETRATATDLVFATQRGTALSRDAVERLVSKYAQTAARHCPTLARKHVTPHVLRHSTATRCPACGMLLGSVAQRRGVCPRCRSAISLG